MECWGSLQDTAPGVASTYRSFNCSYRHQTQLTYRIYSIFDQEVPSKSKKPDIHTYNIKNLIFIHSYERINQKQEATAVNTMILDFYEEYTVVKDDQDPYQEMVQDEEAIDVANETIIPTEDRMSVSLYLAGEIIR